MLFKMLPKNAALYDIAVSKLFPLSELYFCSVVLSLVILHFPIYGFSTMCIHSNSGLWHKKTNCCYILCLSVF